MAKNMQPIAKRCRALGISPAVMGYSGKTSFRNPNGNSRRKKSEYSLQLTEKQKVKFIYGIMEKAAKGEYAAEKVLAPLAEALRALGSEEGAKQVEEFIRQEIHHGELLEQLIKKYRK